MIKLGPSLLSQLKGTILPPDGYPIDVKLRVYGGGLIPDPGKGNPDSALLVISFPLGWGEFNSSNQVVLLSPQSADVVIAGTASYFELVDYYGDQAETTIQGSVGTQGSGADIQFNNIQWAIGDNITLDSLIIQLPQGEGAPPPPPPS